MPIIPGDGIGKEVMPEGLREGPRTPDLGGTASTTDIGKAIANAVAHVA